MSLPPPPYGAAPGPAAGPAPPRAGVAAVVGVGAGVGGAIAARFARAGFAVALLGRDAANLAPVQAEVHAAEPGAAVSVVVANAGNAESLRAAFAVVRQTLGPVDVLVYNAAPVAQRAGILAIDAAAFEDGLRVGCTGALVAAQQVLPDMVARRKGTILLTGAAAGLRGATQMAGLACPKAALRMLGQSMAREFGPQGIHVAHVVLDGSVDQPAARARQQDLPPDAFLAPAAVAEQFYQLHAQHYTTWSQEIDLRPYGEKF